jgi:translation initiation factor IF-2
MEKKQTANYAPRPADAPGGEVKKLEIVVKCDSMGVIDAIVTSIADIRVEGVRFDVIHTGVGPVSKSDLLMALTGSKLVVGFNVEVMPKLEQFIRENGLEIRIYRVIYNLTDDLRKIAQSLIPREPKEEILGKGRVIALFKSSSKDIILGCEVLEGTFEVGKDFRVISAMGPIYTGKIDTMQIEKTSVKQARVQQQVGIKIHGIKKVKLGDLVETFRTVSPKDAYIWSPKGDIVYADR